MSHGWEWLGINDAGAKRLNDILTGNGAGERTQTMKDGPAEGVSCVVPCNAIKIHVTHKHRTHEYERRDDGEFWYTGKSFPRVYAQVF